MDMTDVIITANAPRATIEQRIYGHTGSDISGKTSESPYDIFSIDDKPSERDGRTTVLCIVITQQGRMHESAAVPRRMMRLRRCRVSLLRSRRWNI
jgi:hypothetical protein